MIMPSTKKMASSDMWTHHSQCILKNNKTAHAEPAEPPLKPGSEDPYEMEEWMAIVESKDKYEPRLKSINDDNKVTVSKNSKISSWVVKECGDTTEYSTESGKTVSNGVVVVRSLIWPGSFNFYCHGKYS